MWYSVNLKVISRKDRINKSDGQRRTRLNNRTSHMDTSMKGKPTASSQLRNSPVKELRSNKIHPRYRNVGNDRNVEPSMTTPSLDACMKHGASRWQASFAALMVKVDAKILTPLRQRLQDLEQSLHLSKNSSYRKDTISSLK